MFQAGAADRDQWLEESRVFGYLFGGNGGLHCEYICLNVPGGNHHEIRGKRIQFHIVLTISFRTLPGSAAGRINLSLYFQSHEISLIR
jgi:hypothetical protein